MRHRRNDTSLNRQTSLSLSRPDEPEFAINGAFNPIAELVHRPVVPAAQEHEVVGPRLTAMRPMFDVVALHVALLRAPGKLAMPIPCHQGSAGGWWNSPGFAPHVERITPGTLDDRQ